MDGLSADEVAVFVPIISRDLYVCRNSVYLCVWRELTKFFTIMALEIASIPVLTGEAAERFESMAEKAYENFLNRSDAEKEEVARRYEKGMRLVNEVLSKSKLCIG